MMSQGLCHGQQQTPSRGCAHCHASTSGRQTVPIFPTRQHQLPRASVGSQRAFDCGKVSLSSAMTSGSADLVCLPMYLSFGVLQTALRCGHNAGAGRRAASRFQVHAAAGKAIWASRLSRQLCPQKDLLILHICSLQHLEKCHWTPTETLVSWLTLMLARCVDSTLPFNTYCNCHSHSTYSCPDKPVFFVCGHRYSCNTMHIASVQAESWRCFSKLRPLLARFSYMLAVQ